MVVVKKKRTKKLTYKYCAVLSNDLLSENEVNFNFRIQAKKLYEKMDVIPTFFVCIFSDE